MIKIYKIKFNQKNKIQFKIMMKIKNKLLHKKMKLK